MEKVPTLAEWKAENPGKGLNEYFVKYGHLAHGDLQQPVAPRVVNVDRGNAVNVIAILANGVALAAFLVPWLKFRAVRYGVTDVSPKSLVSFLTSIGAVQMTEDVSLRFTLFTPWLLLLLPVVGLLCALVGHVTIRAIASYIYVAICGYWLFSAYVIAQGVADSTGQICTGTIQAGYYLGVISVILVLADAILATLQKG